MRVPTHPELAREVSVDEFVAWYGPVRLSLPARSQQLVRERESQIYWNEINENRKRRKWASIPPSEGDGTGAPHDVNV
ncbi:hypothetical protein EsH8_XI_000004 [Colletotrichum jinshuiense]